MRERGSLASEPRIRAARAELERATGDEEAAQREIALARERLAAMGAVADAERALAIGAA